MSDENKFADPESSPDVFIDLRCTPEKAADRLKGLGYIDPEQWQLLLDNKLGSHDVRTLCSIALGDEAVSYMHRYDEMHWGEEYGPARIENVRQDLKDTNY